jgi:hypothetical protein
VLHGKFDGSQFAQFMQRLLRQFSGNVFLIVDCHPVHRSVPARQFVETRAQHVHLIRMPGYCREKYLDEVLDQHVESEALGKSRPSKGGGPMAGVSVRQVFSPVAAG